MAKAKPAQIILWLLIATCPTFQTDAGATQTSRSFTSQQIEFFEQKIRPVLVERCYECHSTESKKAKGDLLLDTAQGLLKGGETGPAIIPGDPDKSSLVVSVRYKNETLQMPPKAKLSDQQIADLETWVKMGAPDPRSDAQPVLAKNEDTSKGRVSPEDARKSWAFRRPVMPVIPKVKNSIWVKSPIDAFIVAKLEEKALVPATPADKRTLIRRATFDLTGLPPKPQEIQEFLEDNSPEAFAKVIDRLLSSPGYGERWGRHWLDVVRYADSLDARFRPGALGVTADISESYRFRDWVVEAFNNDLPYDLFIKMQIAGDLFSAADPKEFDPNGIVATTMLSLGRWEQGCSDKEKMLTDVVDDQIDVTSRAFLGLTVACARCHDHKFDPIPTEDYYGLAGIFFSSRALPEPGPKGGDSVRLRVPLLPPAEIERRQKREARLAQLEKETQRITDESLSNLSKDVLAETARYLEAAWHVTVASAKSGDVVKETAEERDLREPILRQWLQFLGEGVPQLFTNAVKNYAGQKGVNAWQGSTAPPWLMVNTNDQEVAIGSFRVSARGVAVHPGVSSSVAVAWKSPMAGQIQLRGRLADGDHNCGNGIAWTLDLRRAHGKELLASGTMANGGELNFAEARDARKLASFSVQENEVIQLVISPNGGFDCDNTMIELEITELESMKRHWNLAEEIVPNLHENGQGNPHSDRFGHRGVWSFYEVADQSNLASLAKNTILRIWFDAVEKAKPDETGQTEIKRVAEEVQRALVALASELKPETDKPTKKEAEAEKSPDAKLYEDLIKPTGGFWKSLRQERSLFPSEVREQLAHHGKELDELKRNAPLPAPVAHGIQEGGVPKSAYEGIGDAKVHIRGRYDRLGKTVPRHFPVVLAGENQPPITEGSGRRQLAEWIASSENPLTARVMANRIWQYHFGEAIVRTPSNFGKLGVPPTHPELLDYLAHAFINSGWSIKAMHRLIMLSSTYQQSSHPEETTLKSDPDNTLVGWMSRRRLEAEAFRDSLLAVADTLDPALKGPAIKDIQSPRRTLYLMAIRSDRNDYRTLFDAADPTAVTDKRTDSTVAPQALFILNDPFVLAQTRNLAQKAVSSGSRDDAKRIEWLYLHLYGRSPTPREVDIGRNVLGTVRAASSGSSRDDCESLAWERYCHVLVCANEFMYVD